MRRQTMAVVLVVVLVATACEGIVSFRLDELRAGAGVPAADTRDNLYLDTTAEARATARCGGPLDTAPEHAYGGETAVAVAELAGVAPLDPAVTDPDEREYYATEALWSQWSADPALVDPDLTEGGVATVDCGDGTLAGALVLREEPALPAEGAFATQQFTNAQLTEHLDLVYATVIDHTGQIVDLTLDIHVPPADGSPRPAMVLFHGGGFTSGNKTNRTNDAKAYARHGFVGITASYRLRTQPVDLVPAALDAIDDGREAVRWLRANADTYGIDTDRIAAAGTSAGGAVALGLATIDDPTPDGPLADVDPSVAAAVSTGGHLTQGLDQLTFDGDEAPALAFHYELDRQGWEYAYQTCTALHDAQSLCDFVVQPGNGHTTNISPAGPWWDSEVGPFLWHHLELGAVSGPTPREPFHMPTMLDESTLDVTVIEDWHVDSGAGTTRQKLIDIHVDDWYDGIEIRVPVRLVLPLNGPVSGFTINGGSNPLAGDHAPTAAEQLALDGGVGVVRTFIKPIAQYPGLPTANQLGAQLVAERDIRYSEPWLWGAIMLRSITAAFADDQIDPGPVLAWGGSKNGATPLISSIHDDRITGVQPSVAPAIYSPVRGHQPAVVADVAASDADFDAAKAAGLPPGDQAWGYYDKAFRSDALLAAQAAGWLPHDVRAFMNGIADDVFVSEVWDELADRGVEIFSEPGSHDWVAYDIAHLGAELPSLRQYVRPNDGHSRPGHPESPGTGDVDEVFFSHHLFGTDPGLEVPDITAQVVGPSLEVTVTFPAGGVPEDSRIFWMYDRGPDGSSWYLYDLFPEANWATMTGGGSTWSASIPIEPGHTHIDVLTTHTVTVDGRTAPVSAPYTRVEL